MNSKNDKTVADSKFRPLKKELKKTVVTIEDAVKADRLPSRNIMLEFMAQVEVMVSYPGFGDTYYDSFIKQCDELHQAFNAKDQSRFSGCLKRLLKISDQCHHNRARE